jgi:hypothetical protein
MDDWQRVIEEFNLIITAPPIGRIQVEFFNARTMDKG